MSERQIGRWDFEGGAYVRIAAFGDIDTTEALDMVEELVKMKRAEITRKDRPIREEAPEAPATPLPEPPHAP